VATFREVPEIGGNFAPLCLENGKSYEKRHCGSKHYWPFGLRPMLRFAVGLKAKAGAGALEVYPPPKKKLKMRDLEKMTRFP